MAENKKRLLIVDTHNTQSPSLEYRLAEAALAHGYDVDYVCGDTQVKPSADIGNNHLRIISTTAENLEQTVQSLCVENPSALIADVNNISAIMQNVKQAHPHISLIGLYDAKQETNIGEALDNAYSQQLRHRCTLMLATMADDRNIIITGERGILPVKGQDRLPEAFLDVLKSRIGAKHHNTKQESNILPDSIAGDVDEVLALTKQWASWSLFPKYETKDAKYPGAEFGFIAKRTNAGTLITARGSNKESPSVDDLALIERIDADGTLHVSSTKRKASLNAPLADRILAERPEINYVVHSHIFLPEGISPPDLSAPGTQQDWQVIQQAVKDGARIINQPLHGTLILLEKPDDLLPLLKRNGLYQHNSVLYDLAYARFQSSDEKPTSLERAVKALELPETARVLDMCCGTGASTLALKRLGFSNIDLADQSASMLAVAEERMGKKGTVARLEDMSAVEGQYDLITVRQAFAYVPPDDLEKVAANIASHLRIGGKFVFNGFAPMAPGTKPRDNEHQDANILIRTHEDNQITNEKVLHTQRTEIIDFDNQRWNAVIDVNEFYQHKAEQLERAFKAAGFNVAFQQEGNSVCCITTLRERKQAQTPAVHAVVRNMTLSLQSCDVQLPKENQLALAEAGQQHFRQLQESIESGQPVIDSYANTWGDEVLRKRLEALTPNWNGPTLVTPSSTNALNMALEYTSKGKTLAVRIPCYFGVLRQANALGIEVKQWENTEDLERIGHCDAILVTSNFSSPAGKSLSEAEKQKIATYAKANNAWVIEDNAYDPLWFEKPPTAIPADSARHICIGSLTKILGPSYRLGFVRADEQVMESLRRASITANLSAPPLEQVVAREGLTEANMEKLRDTLHERAATLQQALVKKFGVTINMPDGGPYVQLPLPKGTDIPKLVKTAKTNGLMIDENCHQYPDNQNRPYIRLHAGAINEQDIPKAVEILHAAFKEIYRPTLGHKPAVLGELPDRK